MWGFVRVIGHLSEGSPLEKASIFADLKCFLRCLPEQTVEQTYMSMIYSAMFTVSVQ